jgi:hypothetical protein
MADGAALNLGRSGKPDAKPARKPRYSKHLKQPWANMAMTDQTASEHCLHQCGMKPTVLDQRHPSD